jgi:hypothetical protein
MSLGVHLLNQAAIIMRPSRLVSVLAAAAALLPAERGAAQDSGVPAASAQPAQGLEEVIVTAQKRPENIQTVPVSIVAFSAEGLRLVGDRNGGCGLKSGIAKSRDLLAACPQNSIHVQQHCLLSRGKNFTIGSHLTHRGRRTGSCCCR